jgi:hypothetical protein
VQFGLRVVERVVMQIKPAQVTTSATMGVLEVAAQARLSREERQGTLESLEIRRTPHPIPAKANMEIAVELDQPAVTAAVVAAVRVELAVLAAFLARVGVAVQV